MATTVDAQSYGEREIEACVNFSYGRMNEMERDCWQVSGYCLDAISWIPAGAMESNGGMAWSMAIERM